MYLHLGQDTIVNERDIVGVFDLDNSTVSRHTRDFLSKAQKEGRVVTSDLEAFFELCPCPIIGIDTMPEKLEAAIRRDFYKLMSNQSRIAAKAAGRAVDVSADDFDDEDDAD